ncbi:IclR family transcriptional regulator [Psychromicrobium xiongbiense]|uniref:IclR family transcriptional regulator n=1 Tax=Psychromicrobium xiongbiense TaxID=3051184 RepID=UPI002556102A|nr:IclR family transcriptional regulator [Psychromicrobium sp. YIM S02556]
MVATDDKNLVGAERVLSVLIALAEEPDGLSLDELTRRIGSAKPTVHRALASLRKLGLANQLGRGTYVLGDEFVRLAYLHQGRRSSVARVEPFLEALTREFGETSHFAILDGDEVVYQAKSDPVEGAIRLTSTIGGRNPARRTAVGKLLLAYRYPEKQSALEWVMTQTLTAKTAKTITDPDALVDTLIAAHEHGFAVDDQENETGVNCVALPIFLDSPHEPTGAVSVSGLSFRTPLSRLVESIPQIRTLAAEFDIRTR